MRIVTSFTGYSNWKGNRHGQVTQHHWFIVIKGGERERVKILIALALKICTIYMHVYSEGELDKSVVLISTSMYTLCMDVFHAYHSFVFRVDACIRTITGKLESIF